MRTLSILKHHPQKLNSFERIHIYLFWTYIIQTHERFDLKLFISNQRVDFYKIIVEKTNRSKKWLKMDINERQQWERGSFWEYREIKRKLAWYVIELVLWSFYTKQSIRISTYRYSMYKERVNFQIHRTVARSIHQRDDEILYWPTGPVHFRQSTHHLYSSYTAESKWNLKVALQEDKISSRTWIFPNENFYYPLMLFRLALWRCTCLRI